MIFNIANNTNIAVVALILIIFAIVLCGSLIYVFYLFSKLKEVFENIALKRNGKVVGSIPRLFFTSNENKVSVYTTKPSRYSSTYTNIDISFFPPSDKNFIIYNEKALSKIGKALGMQDIELGNQEFDSKFMIKGDDERFVKSLLPGYIQMLFFQIHRFNPYIYLEKDKLKIRIPKLIIKEEDYDLLLDTFLKFINHFHEYRKMTVG